MATTKIRYNQIITGLPDGGDANYNNVSLLLHMNGVNNSTGFIDSSLNNYTFNNLGSVSITSAQYKFGSSGKFNSGTNDGLYKSGNLFYSVGTGDITIETWVYLNSMPTSDNWPSAWANHFVVITSSDVNSPNGAALVIGTTQLMFHTDDTVRISGTHSMTTGQWYHIAFTRSSGTGYLFVNGSQIASSTLTESLATGSSTYIGNETNQGGYLNGFLDDFRVTNNVARYTSNFSIPISPFPDYRGNEGKELRVGANGTIELES